ncbi:MAG: phosphotransferase [Cyclobacteriaceae bacterium]|nr:phosphotransferase [Cyclobacteriaceae bacterium]
MVTKHVIDTGNILSQFGFGDNVVLSEPFGEGHIHSSYKVTTTENVLFLQQVNQTVFKNPLYLEHNIRLIASVLQSYFGSNDERKSLYFFPLKNQKNRIHFEDKNGNIWRLSRFIESSFSYQVVPDPSTAQMAAAAFADYILALSACNKKDIYKTIPNFHNASLRLRQFESAIKKSFIPERVHEAKDEIAFCFSRAYLADKLTGLQENNSLKKRIVHHDTKINNILFDSHSRNALCVVDLDTTMPGNILSDFGDMVRTMCNAAPEDEGDLIKVQFRTDIFEGISKGFLNVLAEELSPEERLNLVFGAKLLCWMQSVRFLTDFLKGDVYYKVQHSTHNLIRTRNQIHLLKQIEKEEKQLQEIILDVC